MLPTLFVLSELDANEGVTFVPIGVYSTEEKARNELLRITVKATKLTFPKSPSRVEEAVAVALTPEDISRNWDIMPMTLDGPAESLSFYPRDATR